MENDEIGAVGQTAKNIRLKYREGTLNPLSLLPESKVKLKAAIKENIRLLAAFYISLAGFVDDDDVQFTERNPKSKKTKRVYLKVIEDIETAQKELRRFLFYISFLPCSAWAIVISSAYSKSPPVGSPRANRVTFTFLSFNSF